MKERLNNLTVALENNTKIDDPIIKAALYECGAALEIANHSTTDLCNLYENIEFKNKKLPNKSFELNNQTLFFDKENITHDSDISRELFIETALPKIDSKFQAIVVGYKEIIANNLIGNNSEKIKNIDELIITNSLMNIIGSEPFELMMENKSIKPVIDKLYNMGVDKTMIADIFHKAEENLNNKTIQSNNLAIVMENLIQVFHNNIDSYSEEQRNNFYTSLPLSSTIFEKDRDRHLGINDLGNLLSYNTVAKKS